MEKVIRKIVVGTDSYAYWHRTGDECTVIYISPLNDKTRKVCYHFENNSGISHSDSAWFWTLADIKARKDGKETTIHLLMPKFISQLIEATLQKDPDTFRRRNKVTRFENSYTFLYQMGYEDLEPLWVCSLW